MFFHLKLPEGGMFSKLILGGIENNLINMAETKFYEVGLAPHVCWSFANFKSLSL